MRLVSRVATKPTPTKRSAKSSARKSARTHTRMLVTTRSRRPRPIDAKSAHFRTLPAKNRPAKQPIKWRTNPILRSQTQRRRRLHPPSGRVHLPWHHRREPLRSPQRFLARDRAQRQERLVRLRPLTAVVQARASTLGSPRTPLRQRPTTAQPRRTPRMPQSRLERTLTPQTRA